MRDVPSVTAAKSNKEFLFCKEEWIEREALITNGE